MVANLSIVINYVPTHCLSYEYTHLLCLITVFRAVCICNISLDYLFLITVDQFFTHYSAMGIYTSYTWRKFFRVFSLDFQSLFALSLLNCNIARLVYNYSLFMISYQHVFYKPIIFLNEVLVFSFAPYFYVPIMSPLVLSPCYYHLTYIKKTRTRSTTPGCTPIE